jgi:hypothetical protein
MRSPASSSRMRTTIAARSVDHSVSSESQRAAAMLDRFDEEVRKSHRRPSNLTDRSDDGEGDQRAQ